MTECEREYELLSELLLNEQVKDSVNAVLDKIRDEIKDEMDDIASGCVAKYSYDEGYYSGLRWALRIIEKYTK